MTTAIWTRDDTLRLFQLQLYSLQARIIRRVSRYTLEVEVKGKHYHACIEGYSHDYYLHRIGLHPLADWVNLIICYRHNSCLSKRVLELSSPLGLEYAEFQPPRWFDLEVRGGKAWAQVFTGALLAGSGEAYKMLEQIRDESPAAYYRYLRRTSQLAEHKQGRPVAV